MRISRLWVRAFVMALACLTAVTVSAQSVGNISGTVKDSSGGVVPGAVVTARNQGTAAVREAVTDPAGRYALPLLPIGTYTISASMSGFQTEERRDVALACRTASRWTSACRCPRWPPR